MPNNSKAFLTDVEAQQGLSFGDSPKVRRPKPKGPDGYIPQSSSQSQNTTKLLQKRRKNNEWQQALETKREEFAKRMSECDARQAELKKKCKDLRRRVQHKEQEVQETRSKIDRATKKQDEERVLQQEKEQEIEEKRTQVDKGEHEYDQLCKNLERTNQYKQFLDVVCEENEGHFDEVDRILMRYESLAEQQKEQGEKLVTFQDFIEDHRDQLGKYSKLAVNEVVERNASIAQYRKQLDALVSYRKECETANEQIKQRQQKGIMELGEIEMAVDNLFTRCFLMDQAANSKAQNELVDRVLKLPRDQKTVQMLDRLCVYYLDMQFITKEAKNHQKKEKPEDLDLKSPAKRERKGHGGKAPVISPRGDFYDDGDEASGAW